MRIFAHLRFSYSQLLGLGHGRRPSPASRSLVGKTKKEPTRFSFAGVLGRAAAVRVSRLARCLGRGKKPSPLPPLRGRRGAHVRGLPGHLPALRHEGGARGLQRRAAHLDGIQARHPLAKPPPQPESVHEPKARLISLFLFFFISETKMTSAPRPGARERERERSTLVSNAASSRAHTQRPVDCGDMCRRPPRPRHSGLGHDALRAQEDRGLEIGSTRPGVNRLIPSSFHIGAHGLLSKTRDASERHAQLHSRRRRRRRRAVVAERHILARCCPCSRYSGAAVARAESDDENTARPAAIVLEVAARAPPVARPQTREQPSVTVATGHQNSNLRPL